MIQAYFTTSASTVVPARIPDAEVMELAATMGLSERDLFSIEIPSGATRHATVKVLVAQDSLATLYASTSDGANPSAVFTWQETTNATPMSMDVWLLPPRPLYMVAGGAGVAVVEAVDARWWWSQSQANTLNATPLTGRQQSADGRWRTAGTTDSPATLMTSFIAALTAAGLPGTITVTGYSPNTTLAFRVTDHLFTPECSIAMAIDLLAAATGWVVQRDMTTGTFVLVQVGGDASTLNSWMTSNKRAYVGGAEAPGNTFSPTEPLATLWYGNATYQRNMLPNAVTTTFPYRTVEGKTRYNNTATDATTLMFSTEKEFGWEQTVTTGRARASVGKRVLKEPRPLVASSTPGLTPLTPATAINGTTAPSWNYVTYNTQVVNLLVARASVMAGTVGWAGWPILPTGSFRCTMLRYSLAKRMGDLIPMCVTECDREDWLLGPDGTMATDPKDITLSKGMTHVRKLWSGATMTDTAPPNTRTFLARITGSSPICTGWKWSYAFEEVEPTPNIDCPFGVPIAPFDRTGIALNMMEDTNNQATGFIAPGVSQASYPNATIQPLAIATNTLVMMVEHFPAISDGTTASVPIPQYWFTVPNAVQVTCSEGA